MTDTTLKAFAWNEHEEPLEIVCSDNFDRLQRELVQHLETREYGHIIKTYPASEKLPTCDLTLHYRAFSDAHRGRQIVSGTSLAELDANFQKRKRECALRVFSAEELYALPVRTYYGSWHTITVHLSEEIADWLIDLDAVEKTERMGTRTIVDHDYDGRRSWTLQTVWFDGKPVMVVTSSGRDGDEHHNRWITDAKLFGELVTFLKSFMLEAKPETVEASAKIPALTEFYGHTIHDYYDVDAQEPKKAQQS